jgi:hypothetical protein
MNGVRAVVRAGALAGLLGGALMALVAFRLALAGTPESWHPLRSIAATLLGPEALAGGTFAMVLALSIHVATSVGWGIAFAWAAGTRPGALGALALGLIAGLVVMVFMTFAVLPTINPLLYVHVMEAFSAWVVAHLAFGVGLAFAPYLRRRSLERSRAGGPPLDERLPRSADVR